MEFRTELTEDELDNLADVTIDKIHSLIKYFDFGEVDIDEFEGDEGELILDLNGDNLNALIGKHGSTLQSFQEIVNILASREIGYRYPVTLDVYGYKSRRRDKIEDIAYSMANKAIQSGNSISLKPMSAYERRIIHIALKDEKTVETYSIGEGKNRHLVIKPIKLV